MNIRIPARDENAFSKFLYFMFWITKIIKVNNKKIMPKFFADSLEIIPSIKYKMGPNKIMKELDMKIIFL